MLPSHQLSSGTHPNSASLLSGALRQLALLLFTVFGIAAYLSALATDHYVAPHTSVLIIASALYFSLLCLISSIKRSYYWVALPLAILSVPNAINDLFPSVLMGPPGAETESPTFALFTHIDLFLILGLVRYGRFKLSIQSVSAVLVALFAIFFIAANYLAGAWSTDGIYGLYQVRYALLTYFVFHAVGFENARQPFVLGLISAVILTLMETLTLSFLLAPGHLISGNLGKNPLGHFGAATLCFFIFYRAPKVALLQKYLPLVIAALLMLGSGTRFSVVAAVVSVLWIYSVRSSTLLKNASYVLLGSLAMLTILLFTPQGKSIVDGVTHVSESISTPDLIERTPESSSMITRLHVWQNTADMTFTHWLTGVGPGNWSFLKVDFDIPYDGLLDPHNDLLNFIVSYGIPFGVLFCAAILLYPLIAGHRPSFQRHDSFLQGCYAFMLCIAFTGLTNATLWKHSIFGLTCTFACILIFSRKDRITQ